MNTAAWWILAGAVVAVSWLLLVILGMAARLRDRQVPTIPAPRTYVSSSVEPWTRAAVERRRERAEAEAKVSGYRG